MINKNLILRMVDKFLKILHKNKLKSQRYIVTYLLNNSRLLYETILYKINLNLTCKKDIFSIVTNIIC